jgi:uncharacterized tellurite resistance protein B-like protein
MSVAQLSEDEQVVLLALVGLVARSDGSVSEPEMSALQQLRQAIGPERFERVRDAAAALEDDAAILKAAERVARPDARALIFDAILEMAAPDTIAESEAEVLEHLAESWGLESPFTED